jgi:cation:H+ antiporter
MAYFQLLGGLVLLVFAGDFLVRGSVSASQRLGVPTLLIGLTVVAFGTSAPELVVGVDSVLIGVPTLALGNVVGSNIANIWLVLGIPALIMPMVCTAPKFTHNMMIMLGVSLIFIGFASGGVINWQIGLIFLALLALFLFYSGRRAKGEVNYEDMLAEIDGVPEQPDSLSKALMLVLAGLVGLAIGAHLLVTGAISVARELGVSEAVIGLTIVAIGTSIPELVTSIVAAVRRQCDVAIGNIIGSNIFNILGILGVSSLVGDIPVPADFMGFHFWVMIIASLSLLPFAVYRWPISRVTGAVFTTAYIAYIYMLSDSGQSSVVSLNSLSAM